VPAGHRREAELYASPFALAGGENGEVSLDHMQVHVLTEELPRS
jgi:hypothetical protein